MKADFAEPCQLHRELSLVTLGTLNATKTLFNREALFMVPVPFDRKNVDLHGTLSGRSVNDFVANTLYGQEYVQQIVKIGIDLVPSIGGTSNIHEI